MEYLRHEEHQTSVMIAGAGGPAVGFLLPPVTSDRLE
jgi:hypothetical protein